MANNTNIKTLNDLGTDLMKVYGELRDGSMDIKTADALANVAGKVIGAGKVLLEYNVYKSGGEIEIVKMLDGGDKKPSA